MSGLVMVSLKLEPDRVAIGVNKRGMPEFQVDGIKKKFFRILQSEPRSRNQGRVVVIFSTYHGVLERSYIAAGLSS